MASKPMSDRKPLSRGKPVKTPVSSRKQVPVTPAPGTPAPDGKPNGNPVSERKPGMSRQKLLLLVVLAPLVLSVFAGVFFYNWYIVGVKEVPIEVSITNTSLIGFNTGTDKLYFGTTVPGGASERRTAVVSAYDSIVVIRIEGQVANWVSVSQNNVRLHPNERQDILFRLTAPDNALPGNYTGTAIIQYHRALPWQ